MTAGSAPASHERRTPSPRREKQESRLVRAIGLYKAGKAALMIVIGVALLKLVHLDVADVATRWPATSIWTRRTGSFGTSSSGSARSKATDSA